MGTPRLGARPLLLVATGGLVGTLLRDLITGTGHGSGARTATFAVNVLGALALGVLATALGRAPTSQSLRLLLGTGLLGAFTTWSGLAVQTVLLVRDGDPATAAVYGVGTVVAGVLAAALGVALGTRRRTPSMQGRP